MTSNADPFPAVRRRSVRLPPGTVFAVSLVFLLALSGCASRGPVSLQDMTALPFGAVDPAAPERHSPLFALDHDANVLVLSAGGADGAFGVGVLAGWTQSGRRPQFDVVTGVSTGALAATGAFLGPAYDERLRATYLRVGQGKAFKSRGPLAPFVKDSLFDSRPLAETLARLIDQSTLEAVAVEDGKGRRLFVATTNLDSGAPVVWDMGAIAASGRPDRLDLFRRVLLASAAVPATFSPVYIRADGRKGAQMQVDGGVHAPALLQGFMLSPPHAATHVWVIVNTRLKSANGGQPIKPTVMAIATRASLEMYRALTERTIYQAYVMTEQAGGSFNMLYVPDDIPGEEDSLEVNLADVRALYDRGEIAGRNGAWLQEPGGLDPLLRFHR